MCRDINVFGMCYYHCQKNIFSTLIVYNKIVAFQEDIFAFLLSDCLT